MKRIFRCVVILLCSAFLQSAIAGALTNQDVIKLLDAKMPEDVILQAIVSGQNKFDTSPAALIKLREKGATPLILKAMINPAEFANKSSSGKEKNASVNKPAANETSNPEEVMLLVNGAESNMQYIIPQMRTASRAFGFGGVATYASLNNSAAQRRITSTLPEFIVSVPKNAQAPNYLTLASFVVRDNGNREVLVGGGFLSYSSGIHKDRVIPVKTEVLSSQAKARDGFVLYKVTPEKELAKGEYALVLYTGELRVAGFFAQAANSYFDFGVD
ncbi:hypothetical protein H8K35_01685 [Undibacterium sp. LX40W]|uniref:Uncharacterized protein n=1 Tax=Undibacterium nitidum TaxID=2762298 RepID=A0A923KT39_9BURK|nr:MULTISPECIES: hypothetical protein [Undibacterium]MBC3880907.1 hypothetical protein [Undibacterium nitidum]MBC3890360.1 hypothetical protein [Undibacterium sp. LX40W]